MTGIRAAVGRSGNLSKKQNACFSVGKREGVPAPKPMERSMALVAFLVFTLIGQILNVFLSLAIDKIYSPAVGVLTFVVLYALVFVVAYKLALFLFDREQPQTGSKRSDDNKVRKQGAQQQPAFR
jgi:hypothetical protein